MGLPLVSLGLGDKMNPALDSNFSPNAEAIFIQLLHVMTSIKSKGITIPTNTLKQLFQGQASGVQAGAFLIRERQGGTGDRGQRGRGGGDTRSSGRKLQNLPHTQVC